MIKPEGRRRFAMLAAATLGLSVLGGCAGFHFGLQKPEVSLADIRLLDGNLLEQRFLLSLRVTNPNNVDIPVEGLNFTLDINGGHFARGVGNQPVVIPRLGEAMVEVTATTGLGSFLRQFKELAKGRDKMEYRLKGRLVTGNLGGFDFDRSGDVCALKGLGEPAGRKPPSEQF